MMNDLISDSLTRIRNAQMVRHAQVKLKYSKMICSILEIFKNNGYVHEFFVENSLVSVHLKYDDVGFPVISGLRRYSKPGLRIYVPKSNIPIVQGGFGTAILSTSQGIMTGSKAKKLGIGGEVICTIW